MSDTAETETDTNTNTDEPSKAKLHDRVRKLESTVEKLMPSRRDALRMGAAGIAGAAGLGAASQSADASTGSAGTIGSNSDRPDLFADDIDANSLSGSVKNQGCRVFLSTDQSIASGVRDKIQFDSVIYDSDNNFDVSANRWTCPEDGLYAANLQVGFVGGGSSQNRQISIGLNGDPQPSGSGGFNRDSDADLADNLSVSTINKYQQGDDIAGFAVNFDANDTIPSGDIVKNTFLEVAFLGGL